MTSSADTQVNQPFRFGAQLYSVRERCQTPEGFRRTMREIADIGYKGVQVSGQSAALEPRMIRDACDACGLEIVCTHVPFGDLKDHQDKIIQSHRIYGCRYPGLGSLPGQYYENGLTGIREFVAVINGVADRLAEHGLRLLYHNHAHEFQRFDGQLVFDVLTRECSDNVQFEIDTYWVQCGGGDPVKYLRGRSADVIHFKDMIGTARNVSMITTVGKGNLDWPAIIQACRDTRVQWAMVEQDNAAELGDSIQAMAYAFDFLTKQGVSP